MQIPQLERLANFLVVWKGVLVLLSTVSTKQAAPATLCMLIPDLALRCILLIACQHGMLLLVEDRS